MTYIEIEIIKNLGKKIEGSCFLDNIGTGCSAIDALAEFYDGPHSELVVETLTYLVDVCETSDQIKEHLYKTIKRLKQSDKIRSLGSKS